jgi:hypothetical protein
MQVCEIIEDKVYILTEYISNRLYFYSDTVNQLFDCFYFYYGFGCFV